jgi:hypothetical protein
VLSDSVRVRAWWLFRRKKVPSSPASPPPVGPVSMGRLITVAPNATRPKCRARVRLRLCSGAAQIDSRVNDLYRYRRGSKLDADSQLRRGRALIILQHLTRQRRCSPNRIMVLARGTHALTLRPGRDRRFQVNCGTPAPPFGPNPGFEVWRTFAFHRSVTSRTCREFRVALRLGLAYTHTAQ